MNQGLGLFLIRGGVCPDLVIENGQLKFDNGLETVSLISMFTDQRVEPDDLPDDVDDPRGWWGDQFSDPTDDQIGSTLWLHDRGTILSETANNMEDAARAAFQWMIDDGIADNVTSNATLIEGERIDIAVDVFRPNGDDFRFKFVWDGQEMRRVGNAA